MQLIKRQTEISAHLVLFCRFLRQHGYSLGPKEEIDALSALECVPFDKEQDFINALKAVLAKSRWQHQYFEEHYHAFWEELDKAVDGKIRQQAQQNQLSESQKRKAQFEALKSWLNLKETEDERPIAAASRQEVLSRKHFSDLSPDEMQLMMRLLQKAARKLNREKSRLRKKAKIQKKVDIRRSIRYSMKRGGEIQQLLFYRQKERRLKLVLLCDVSKSMDLYSRFFIHLIYAFQNAYDRIETFVFSTALHRVSDLFEHYDLAKAYALVSDRVPQWSGGTTIGQCLQRFSSDYAHGLLDKKTVVLILSDGWDTGDPKVMELAMKTMRKAARKIIWLNPLAGSPNFAPEALGMKTALPFIDVLAAAHNLESLKSVLKYLGKKRHRLQQVSSLARSSGR